MDASQIAVTVAGIVTIALLIWYFFLYRPEGIVAQVAAGANVQEVSILVKGGYTPNRIEVERGKRVRLLFDREENASCSEEVVFPDFGIRKDLPAFHTTAIELDPKTAGAYEFTCGMHMMRGTLIVK